MDSLFFFTLVKMRNHTKKLLGLLFLTVVLAVTLAVAVTTRSQHHRVSVPPLRTLDTLTPHVFITYRHLHRIPPNLRETVAKMAQGFTVTYFTDRMCDTFLQQHYPEAYTYSRSLHRAAHRSDIFRYCVLYHYGGVYLDVKCIPRRPLRELFQPQECTTVLSLFSQHAFQGIMGFLRHDASLRDMLREALDTPPATINARSNYLLFTRQCYDVL